MPVSPSWSSSNSQLFSVLYFWVYSILVSWNVWTIWIIYRTIPQPLLCLNFKFLKCCLYVLSFDLFYWKCYYFGCSICWNWIQRRTNYEGGGAKADFWWAWKETNIGNGGPSILQSPCANGMFNVNMCLLLCALYDSRRELDDGYMRCTCKFMILLQWVFIMTSRAINFINGAYWFLKLPKDPKQYL